MSDGAQPPAPPAAEAPVAREARGAAPRYQIPWRALTMVGALLVIWIVFALLTEEGRFLTPRNLSLLARQMAVTSILAIGMVLVIVTGQIDLSVGAMAGLLGAVASMAVVYRGWPVPVAFAAGIGLGALAGLVQGTLVAKLKIPPFIVTLGGMLIFQGVLLGWTGGISIIPPGSFLRVGQTYVPPNVGWVLAGLLAAFFVVRAFVPRGPVRWKWLGLAVLALVPTGVMNAYNGIPVPVLLMLVLAGLFAGIARHTAFGRHLYAIGGNREAAFYSGSDIDRRIMGVYTLMGMLCAVAGIVLTARVGAATSDAGRMMELDAIAAAVIGGTSLLGGQGTVWGALLGAMVMASLDNGMSLLNTESFWQPIIKGAILVAAVAADLAGRRGKR